MGDIVKIFYEVGEIYKDEMINNYNEIKSKNIDKIVVLDLKTGDERVYDRESVADRFFLRVTSPNGGNLFPFLFLSDKLASGVKKAFKNMRSHLPREKHRELDEIEALIDGKRLEAIANEYKSAKNFYFGLMYGGKTFNELYPEIISDYIDSACSGGITTKADCYMGKEKQIGFDAKLNFCSVNELPKRLQRSTKYRLLPLSKSAASFVRQGFEKIFYDAIFRFRLFGLDYYLLPTVFLKDEKDKKRFYATLASASRDDSGDISGKEVLEARLERLVERLESEQLAQKALFTFLFAEKNNNEIKLYQTIEDVAPTRIKKAAELMADFDVNSTNLSKHIKKGKYKKESLYIRDYINDGLLLAKLIFGKESISDIDKLYRIINKKIMFGDNEPNNPKREYSKILSGYFEDDTDFEKHQRFLDFLDAVGAIRCGIKNSVYGGGMNRSKSFRELMDIKFNTVELFKEPRAREFYIVGALARFVVSWQYSEGSDSVEKYINSIGSVSTQNIDRVFRKIYEGSKKYGMHGAEFDELLSAYSDIKSQVRASDNLSIDKANIAFVMGNIDYKNYRAKSKEESAQ